MKIDVADWFPRMTTYGFESGMDYRLVTQKRETKNPKNPFTEYTDYLISVDMAKQQSVRVRESCNKIMRVRTLAQK